MSNGSQNLSDQRMMIGHTSEREGGGRKREAQEEQSWYSSSHYLQAIYLKPLVANKER